MDIHVSVLTLCVIVSIASFIAGMVAMLVIGIVAGNRQRAQVLDAAKEFDAAKEPSNVAFSES